MTSFCVLVWDFLVSGKLSLAIAKAAGAERMQADTKCSAGAWKILCTCSCGKVIMLLLT